jgi:hypothetical protein
MTKTERLNKLFRAHYPDRPSVYDSAELVQAEIVKALKGVLDQRKAKGLPYSQTISITEAVELIEGLF